jgi:hypothetical protein
MSKAVSRLAPERGIRDERLSNCHRTVLTRQWLGTGGEVNWIMLNPSTADDVFNDPTIRTCVPVEFPMNFVSGSDVSINQDRETGYIEIKDAPTGFMMIRRSVFEQMMEEYPDLKCELRQDTPAAEAPFEYAFFDTFIDTSRRYLSEDYGFSRLWQAAGGRLWMDPEINLKHYGQYCYQGSIATALESVG